MGMPVRTLQRRLKETGINYRQLVQQERSNAACDLLEKPGIKVSEVARALGYKDVGSFSRAFTKWMAMSPSEYRLHLHT